MAKVNVQGKVDPELKARLRVYLAETGQTESSFVERLIAEFFDADSSADDETLDKLTQRVQSLRFDMQRDMANFVKLVLMNSKHLPDGELEEETVDELLTHAFGGEL